LEISIGSINRGRNTQKLARQIQALSWPSIRRMRACCPYASWPGVAGWWQWLVCL